MKIVFKRHGLLMVLAAIILMTGCGKKQTDDNRLNVSEDVVTFQMSPSSSGVKEFLNPLNDYDDWYEEDKCYNVTPQEISDRYGFNIFKFASSCYSCLLYENKIYPLGDYLGGYGVTSFAIADVNSDGSPELYFTFSWGSGIHRSQIGYFDTADKKTVIFDYQCWLGELMLESDTDNVLCVYHANWDVKSFVDIEMSTDEKAAEIALVSGDIVFVEE